MIKVETKLNHQYHIVEPGFIFVEGQTNKKKKIFLFSLSHKSKKKNVY